MGNEVPDTVERHSGGPARTTPEPNGRKLKITIACWTTAIRHAAHFRRPIRPVADRHAAVPLAIGSRLRSCQFGWIRNVGRTATTNVQSSQTIEFIGVRPDDESPIRKRHFANMHPPFATPTAECRRRHLQFQGQLLHPPLVRLMEAGVNGSIPVRPSAETLAREHRPHGPRVECVPAMR